MLKNGTDIEATTITLSATATLTTIKICQLKTIPYIHILQYIVLQTKVKFELEEYTY